MTDTPPLTDTDKTLLSFLAQSDRFLYDFLDAELLSTYAQARPALRRLTSREWVSTGWSDDGCMIYRIADLGRRCLETGLQLEQAAEAKTRFPWRFPN